MKKNILLIVIALFVFPLLCFSTDVNIAGGNLYANWLKLSLTGKEQAEIEYFFRDADKKEIERVKKRLRLVVIDRLRKQRVKSIIQNSNDLDDIYIAVRLATTEIRYVGLEEDEEIRYLIKEEFGIRLQNTSRSNNFLS